MNTPDDAYVSRVEVMVASATDEQLAALLDSAGGHPDLEVAQRVRARVVSELKTRREVR